jgi:ribosomal RNA assembly protein
MIECLPLPEKRIELLKADKRIVKTLEELSNTHIKVNSHVMIEGEDPISVMKVREVLKAIGRGFAFEEALLLLKEGYALEVISLSDFSKSKKRSTTLKGRVIGREGTAKEMIQRLTNTKISIYGKTICVIGKWEDVQKAKRAVEMLLCGSKHNTVYKFLEGGL